MLVTLVLGSSRPRPIMLKIIIMLLSSAQKFTHYAQYYAHIISSMLTNQFIILKENTFFIGVYLHLGMYTYY